MAIYYIIKLKLSIFVDLCDVVGKRTWDSKRHEFEPTARYKTYRLWTVGQ